MKKHGSVSKKNNKRLPLWPPERSLERYSELTQINFKKSLSNNTTWMDVGCRTGKALIQTRKMCKAKLVGINEQKIKVKRGIYSIQASIPKDQSVYKKFKEKVDLLTDIHGAVTYYANPLEALIYEASLLASDGRLVCIVTSKRISNLQTWKRIKKFFQTHMNQQLKLNKFTTYADGDGSRVVHMRVEINGKNSSQMNLKKLFQQAKRDVGVVKKYKIFWQSSDRSAKIWQVVYKKNN